MEETEVKKIHKLLKDAFEDTFEVMKVCYNEEEETAVVKVKSDDLDTTHDDIVDVLMDNDYYESDSEFRNDYCYIYVDQ